MTRILSTLLVAMLLSSMCISSFAQTKAPNPDDVIYNQVKRKLANDPDVRGGAFDVEVKNGVVTIKGKVEKQKFKDKAEHIVKKVKGVKQVVNQLKIESR